MQGLTLTSTGMQLLFISLIPQTPHLPRAIILLFFDYSNYDILSYIFVVFDTNASRFRIPIQLTDLENEGFNSGDSIYLATYASATYGFSPLSDYYDPQYGQYVLTSIDRTPSPVIGLKIP